MSSLNIPRQSKEMSDPNGLGSANSSFWPNKNTLIQPADSSLWLYDNDFQPENDCSQPVDYIFGPISLGPSIYQSPAIIDSNCKEFLASQNEAACDSTGSLAMDNTSSLSPISHDHGSTLEYSLSGVDAAELTFGCGDAVLGDWSSIALQNTAVPNMVSPMSVGDNWQLEALARFAFDSNPFPGIETDRPSPAPEAAFSVNEALHPTTPTTVPRQFQCNRLSTKSQSAGETCRSSFHQQRDYDRHLRTVHAEKHDPKYRCRCTASTARKDNYMRHIQKCAKELLEPFYHCKCGDECRDKSDHLRHVKDCAKCNGKRGRPSGTRGTA